MYEFDLSIEHRADAKLIIDVCERKNGWRVEYAKHYYDKLRRAGISPDDAFDYTLARARNLAEQKVRRISHETGAT